MDLFSKWLKKNGSSGRTRTYNPPVNSRAVRRLLIDSKGFSSGSMASEPLYLSGLARQFARQFLSFHPSVGTQRECRNYIGRTSLFSRRISRAVYAHLFLTAADGS